MVSADQISCRNLGRRSWASAPTGRRASHINHPGQRRTAKRLRQRVRENGWESRQRSPQKGPATPDNPSVTAAPCQLPLHKGALGTGDADCRVGPAGLLAMTMVFCHSEERSDVGIRPFYDERGFGPMYLGHGLRRPNFVPKFGRRSWASAPTPCGGTGVGTPGRRALRVGAGGFINCPGEPARNGALATAGRGTGRNR